MVAHQPSRASSPTSSSWACSQYSTSMPQQPALELQRDQGGLLAPRARLGQWPSALRLASRRVTRPHPQVVDADHLTSEQPLVGEHMDARELTGSRPSPGLGHVLVHVVRA